MHAALRSYLGRLSATRPHLFRGRILECGSMDVNGSPRPFFSEASEYVGIDWRGGPGVDQVGLIHEWRGAPYEHFDTVLSTETLEHDPYWSASLLAMNEFVKVGGSLIITCAGPGREPHCPEGSPPIVIADFGEPVSRIATPYYANQTYHQVLRHCRLFAEVLCEYDAEACDTRVCCIGRLRGRDGWL